MKRRMKERIVAALIGVQGGPVTTGELWELLRKDGTEMFPSYATMVRNVHDLAEEHVVVRPRHGMVGLNLDRAVYELKTDPARPSWPGVFVVRDGEVIMEIAATLTFPPPTPRNFADSDRLGRFLIEQLQAGKLRP